ncbi:MAG: Tetratricopeptide repeat protein [Syntrophaceae bacterium PtaU1.Bin231]|nr:MAG: Tetratricopeptide repeat protein [Syntrophaceae bacterium PtaU1.Bin231]
MAYARLAYDPWETSPEERRATFVGREALIRQLMSAVAEQQGHNTIQHYLILGPRGIGKTTILLAVRDKVRADLAFSGHWLCVQLREEEYFVRTLRDLLYLTLRALADDEGLADAGDLAEQAHRERDHDRSLAAALDGLRSISETHGKRILLLIDNFDRVFPRTPTGRRKKGAPENEYRAFRKLLSTESFLMVIGASVRLFEEIAAYDQAFFNFFCPVEIPNLSDDEICEVLRKRAEADENHVFLRQLDGVRDRVRAVTWMTGGNPRLVLMLYDVLRQRDMMPVVQALRETVGGLTPILKHIMDDMPRQQSKTLDALIRLGGVASPSAIADMARLPLNVVTTQLGRLKDARFVAVEGEGKGRPAFYRVADPMFRTWYQIRYLRPAGRRIEIFVDFLRAWFSVADRRRFIEDRWKQFRKGLGTGSYAAVADTVVGIPYYAAGLDDERERQGHFDRLAESQLESGRAREAADVLAELTAPFAGSQMRYEAAGYRALADRLLDKGEPKKAIATYAEALKKDPRDAGARMGLGLAFGLSGDHTRAGKEFDSVLSLPTLSADLRANALVNRGVSKGMLGDMQGAIADFTAAAELPGAPADQVAKALVNRGACYGNNGDHEHAFSDFGAALNVDGISKEQRLSARLNRGAALRNLDRRNEAILDFTECAETGTDVGMVHHAVAWLVRIHLQQNQQSEAIRWATRLSQLEPGDAQLDARLEARINLILDVGRKTSLSAAESLLDAFITHDSPEIRERLGFLKPGIEFAKTADEKTLTPLPEEEQKVARQIAAVLKGAGKAEQP